MGKRSEVEHSAGAVVVRVRERGPEFLVIRDRYGHWGLPKGHVEEGEDPLRAALRECAEETGVSELESGPHLGTIDWRFRRGGRAIHKFCDFFLLTAPADAEARPQRAEGITGAEWLPAGEAVKRIDYANTRRIAQRAVEALGGIPSGGDAAEGRP